MILEKIALVFLKIHSAPFTSPYRFYGNIWLRSCHLIGRKCLPQIVYISSIMASLTSEQMFAEERILEGHNIILTDQAGTEKLISITRCGIYNNILLYSVGICLY